MGMAETKTRKRREMRDMRVCDVMQKAVLGELSWEQARLVLGYTDRHMRRLRRRFADDGELSLKDGRAGPSKPNRGREEVKQTHATFL